MATCLGGGRKWWVRPSEGHLPPSTIFVAKPISPDVVHETIEEYRGRCDVR
jgi:hypothetical protein